MEFSDETIDFLSRSSAISLNEEEKKQLREDLAKIFSYIESLNTVYTDQTPSCTHPLDNIYNVVRDDIVDANFDRQNLFENCPSHIGGMVRVPTIIHKDL